jgi:hypothetical protein
LGRGSGRLLRRRLLREGLWLGLLRVGLLLRVALLRGIALLRVALLLGIALLRVALLLRWIGATPEAQQTHAEERAERCKKSDAHESPFVGTSGLRRKLGES